ncbi:MAG: amidophosphoribosyltransferase [Candidatus Latescibacteria bacterium]|nr:amidophosphoribosyltransferase [Candidatus Latescibacterota bacterium]
MEQQVKHYCGIFGIYGTPEAAAQTALGLHALQHRGEESCGIASGDGKRVHVHTGMGQVADVFSKTEAIDNLPGNLAIGHNRYSTTGSDNIVNAQPFVAECRDGSVAIAHNGNLTNTAQLRKAMQNTGSIFQTTTDSELILHLIARSPEQHIADRTIDALRQIEGAYSLVFATESRLMAARDPHGFRPLCLGQLGDSWVIASESCALDIISARYIRDIEPGELLIIDANGLRTYTFAEVERNAFCIFEYIYFSRPDSLIFGDNVDKTRRRLGKQLALEHPANADIVIPVPDSSNTAAMGYAVETGLKLEIGLIRNHYVGRTFITPGQDNRGAKVRLKFNPVRGVINGKRVVIVEDSIVRGTTLRHLVRTIREAGARQVHVRISCPPIVSPCFYGIDFQSTDELIAGEKTVDEIREHLGVDSLGYLSLEGMLAVSPNAGRQYCTACFNRNYPITIESEVDKLILER